MMMIIILSVATMCIFLAMGLYILSLNPGNKVNLAFFATILSFVLSNILLIVIHAVSDEATAVMIYRTATSMGILFFTLIIILITYISNIFNLYNIRRFQNLFLGVVIFIQTLLICRNYSLPLFVELVKIDGTWRMVKIQEEAHFFLVSLYWLISTIIITTIMLLWRKKTKSLREQKQAAVLLGTFVSGSLIMLIYMVLIIDVFKLIKYPIAGDASVVICIWVAGFGYSIARYRFLSITPEYISSELLSNIEESVMLLGPDKNIITINNSAKEIIDGRDSGNVTQFSKNIPEYDIIDEKVNALLDGSQDNFTYRVSFNNGGGPTRYFDARFSLVRDRFNDILGILVIAREDRDLNQLKTIHKITDRQMDIITMALSGLSNRELAARLNISEKTVENHMINIYNKLGVNNKIELYNLVKQYHVGGNPASA